MTGNGKVYFVRILDVARFRCRDWSKAPFQKGFRPCERHELGAGALALAPGALARSSFWRTDRRQLCRERDERKKQD